MTRMRRITIESPGYFCNLDGPVEGALEWARQIVEKVPPEYRATSHLEAEDGECGSYLTLWYERPETDLDRQNDEREKRESEAMQNAAEYDRFLRLKAKYEPVT